MIDTTFFDNSTLNFDLDNYEDYKEDVFDIANSYDDGDITYTDAEMMSRDIAGTYGTGWYTVLADFEQALLILQK